MVIHLMVGQSEVRLVTTKPECCIEQKRTAKQLAVFFYDKKRPAEIVPAECTLFFGYNMFVLND